MQLSSIFKIIKFLAAVRFHDKNELLVSFKDQSASFKCQNSKKFLLAQDSFTKVNISEVINTKISLSSV